MKCEECKNASSNKCKYCNINPLFSNEFSPKVLKDDECQCLSCHRIFTDGIFRLKDNPKAGLCFDCY